MRKALKALRDTVSKIKLKWKKLGVGFGSFDVCIHEILPGSSYVVNLI